MEAAPRPRLFTFRNGLFRVSLTDSSTPDSTGYNYQDAGQITVRMDRTRAAPGPWDVEVMNPQGPSAVLPGGLLVLSPDG